MSQSLIVERRIRWYQQPLHSFLVNGGKRAIEIAHRRWGKDEIALAATCELAHRRVGNYWHCLPEYEQGRKALWTAVNAHTGKRRIDEAFPPQVRASANEQEMFIRLRNGSTWQIIGSDRYNATVGAGVAGIVYSEFALADPSAWAFHRPMLEENDGWAAFITTPRGNNHAKSMLDMARTKPDLWFAEVSSIADTQALNQAQLDESLAEYIALFGEDVGTAQFEQEYHCSFNAAILGAYFGREMAQAERDGRIRKTDVDERYPVDTAWDLGKAANNPIWCFQNIPGEMGPRIVDFYRPDSDDLDDWVKWLDDRGYDGTDFVPHDISHTEWGSKRTRHELLASKRKRVRRIPMVSVEDGRMAARQTIKVAVFHKGSGKRGQRMTLGTEGLKQYRREWDADLKIFRQTPVKDWAEHIGSAFRYLGLAWKAAREEPKPKEPDKHVLVGQPDGSVKSTLTVAELIKRQQARRTAKGSVRI
jgi:phage terminase large subunit